MILSKRKLFRKRKKVNVPLKFHFVFLGKQTMKKKQIQPNPITPKTLKTLKIFLIKRKGNLLMESLQPRLIYADYFIKLSK